MQIDIHSKISGLIKDRKYILALENAVENDFHILNTVATNMQMTQIYSRLYRDTKLDMAHNDLLIDKSLEYAAKTENAHRKILAASNEEINFKSFRIISEAYRNAAIHSRVKYKEHGISTEEIDRLKEQAFNYSAKAVGILDESSEHLQNKLNIASGANNSKQIFS